MITITKNKNFSNWFDLNVFGSLVDQFNCEHRALHEAKRIRRKEFPKAKIKIVESA